MATFTTDNLNDIHDTINRKTDTKLSRRTALHLVYSEIAFRMAAHVHQDTVNRIVETVLDRFDRTFEQFYDE